MLRRSAVAVACLAAALSTSPAPVIAGDDPRLAEPFLTALRDKGYYDLAIDYIDQIRRSEAAPPDLLEALDYEEGRTLIEAAMRANDPEVNRAKYDQAKVKIDSFLKDHPANPRAIEALVELAKLLNERARSERDLATNFPAGTEHDARVATARGLYDKAKTAFDQACDKLAEKLNTFSKGPGDPRLAERERTRVALMLAELQRAVVDYDKAQTFPADAKERADLLNKSLVAFDDLHKRYRRQMAGMTAQMWQGKCFEEQNKLGEAMGIYNELMEHSSPDLDAIQKQVGYFRIIIIAKRKEYALAADECRRWLAKYPKDRQSYESFGVELELGKNILAQLPTASSEDEKAKAIRVATDALADVVRVVSPFKPEAMALLQKYRPNIALKAADIAKLTADEAYQQALQALSTQAYDNAITLLKVAIRKHDPNAGAAKLNGARLNLAYAEYMTKRYPEAVVLGEFVARHYPRDEWAAKAANMACLALVESYNSTTTGNRTTDIDHLIELAKYTAETFNDTEQGDSARMMLGQAYFGRGQVTEAVAAFEAVRSASPLWVEAQTACGDAHWRHSIQLRKQKQTKEADAEVQAAIAKLQIALKARRDANAPDNDPAFINNACALAEIELELGQTKEALDLLGPIVKKVGKVGPGNLALANASARLIAGMLRGHVAAGQVDAAIADMRTLESSGGSGSASADLYFRLGTLLEGEIDRLGRRNDQQGLARTQQSFRKFLNALVASKSGQSFQSLQWAGESLLKLGAADEANGVFVRFIDTYANDPEFQKTPNAADRLLRVRLKQVTALRVAGKLPEAEAKLAEVIDANKRSLNPQMELGHLLDAKAEADKSVWPKAYAHWHALARKLDNASPRPNEYYDAWYHAALALQKQGKVDLAKSTAASILRLSARTCPADMKAKLQAIVDAKPGK